MLCQVRQCSLGQGLESVSCPLQNLIGYNNASDSPCRESPNRSKPYCRSSVGYFPNRAWVLHTYLLCLNLPSLPMFLCRGACLILARRICRKKFPTHQYPP